MIPYTLEIRDENTNTFLFENDILLDVAVYNDENGEPTFDIEGYYVKDIESNGRIVKITDPEIIKLIAVRENKICDDIEYDVLTEFNYVDEYRKQQYAY